MLTTAEARNMVVSGAKVLHLLAETFESSGKAVGTGAYFRESATTQYNMMLNGASKVMWAHDTTLSHAATAGWQQLFPHLEMQRNMVHRYGEMPTAQAALALRELIESMPI